MTFKIIIPARYASSRLPAKPLADIAGKPMVVRVWECAKQAGAEEVWVAADHPEIVAAVEAAGGKALLTRVDHPSGTDRLAEVVDTLAWADDTIVVNLQGDEPLMDAAILQRVAALLAADQQAAMATAAHPIDSIADFLNPAVVKVVCDAEGAARYFSRAPIPWPRDAFALSQTSLPAGLAPLRHIGLYAYRARFLRAYTTWPAADLEQWEMLEQLRALWHGQRIRVTVLEQAPPAGVDTPDDLARVRAWFAAHL